MSLEFVDLGPFDYDRAKKIFNAAKHPAFVGRELVFRCATTGRAVVAVLDGADVGVALVAKGKLQAMSVVKSAQGGGVGGRLLAHVKPRFASVIGEKVAWFEKRGYRPVGGPNVGQNGKHITQLMELIDTVQSPPPSGDPTIAIGPTSTPPPITLPPRPPREEPPKLSLRSMISADSILSEQADRELTILDDLYGKALEAGKYDSALKITERAARLIKIHSIRKRGKAS